MGYTPLHYASGKGYAGIVQLLLDRKAPLNAKCNSGEAPLHWAANNGHGEVVEILLGKGADPNAKGHMGRTPLMYAKDDTIRGLLMNAGGLEG